MAAASPGLTEATDEAVDQEADISYLTVGFWRRSAKPGPLSLLVMHSKQMFVLISEEPWKGQQVQSAGTSNTSQLALGRRRLHDL